MPNMQNTMELLKLEISAGGPGSGRHKLSWETDKGSTGRYKSFYEMEKQFPVGKHPSGEPAVQMIDEGGKHYSSDTKNATDLKLKVMVAIPNKPEDRGTKGSWSWRTMANRANSIAEAKQQGAKYFDKHPEHIM